MNKVAVIAQPNVETATIPSSLLWQGQMRLDAAHYSKAKPEIRKLLEASGYDLVPLANLSEEIFNLPRFRRVYASDPSEGWPYMTPGQLVMFRYDQAERFISRARAPKTVDRHFLKKDWILVTCSGTVGRAMLATEALTKFFVTHDLIRIVPKKGTKPGYVVAYLSSRIGQTLLKDEYGGTIDHIEPIHVKPLPVPMLPNKTQEQIDDLVREAYELRDRANQLLEEAERMIETALWRKMK